jgi:hypothetical protein
VLSAFFDFVNLINIEFGVFADSRGILFGDVAELGHRFAR